MSAGSDLGRGALCSREGCTHDSVLRERVKELDCLYSIAKIVERPKTGLDAMLHEIVRVFPDAWQHPHVARGRIILDDQEVIRETPDRATHRGGGGDGSEEKGGYRVACDPRVARQPPGPASEATKAGHTGRPLVFSSVRHGDAKAIQEAVIIVDGLPLGRVEVAYLEEMPEADEGPFLNEERRLINIIAQRIGEAIEKKETETKIASYQEQLRSLASQITSTEMRERRRIARELHDRIGQSLATVKIRLGLLMGMVQGPKATQILADVRQALTRTIQDTRSLIFDISPPVLYEFGLDAALEWLGEQTLKKHGLTVEYHGPGELPALDDDLQGFLFQAAGELIANTYRHAETDRVRLHLERSEDALVVRVEDDGVGFDLEAVKQQLLTDSKFGLFSISQRLRQLGGRMDVTSAPGQGTKVELMVPISSDVTSPNGLTTRPRGP